MGLSHLFVKAADSGLLRPWILKRATAVLNHTMTYDEVRKIGIKKTVIARIARKGILKHKLVATATGVYQGRG